MVGQKRDTEGAKRDTKGRDAGALIGLLGCGAQHGPESACAPANLDSHPQQSSQKIRLDESNDPARSLV
jgi:hypothetical protein